MIFYLLRYNEVTLLEGSGGCIEDVAMGFRIFDKNKGRCNGRRESVLSKI